MKIKKISSLILSLFLVIATLPSLAFAQDNTSEAKILKESTFHSFIEDSEAMDVNYSEIDLSDLPSSEVLLSDVTSEIDRVDLADEVDAKEIKLPNDIVNIT